MNIESYCQLSFRTRLILSMARMFDAFSWRPAFLWIFLFALSFSVFVGVNFLRPRLQAMSLPFASQELKELEAYVMLQSSQNARAAEFLADAEDRSRSRGLASAWIARSDLESMTEPAFASPSMSPGQRQAMAQTLPNTAAAMAEREALRQKIRASLAASTTCRNYADKFLSLNSPSLSPSFDEGCIAADKRELLIFAFVSPIFVLMVFVVAVTGYVALISKVGMFPEALTLGMSSSKEEWLATRGSAIFSRMESSIFSLASSRARRSLKRKPKRL